MGTTTTMASNLLSIVAVNLASCISDPATVASLLQQILLQAGVVAPPRIRRDLRQRRQHRA